MWCVPTQSFMIFLRVSLSGIATNIFLSNLLKAAISNSHGMLVVAKTDTLSSIFLIISIYLRNSVLIRLSVSLSLPVLFRPKESISSMRRMEGLSSRAISKSICKSFSLSPINFDVMSARETQIHFAFEWWETAYASMVLPTPGG